MELITLSTSRNILQSGSPDRARMALYAKHLDTLHIIVLTRRDHGFRHEVHEGNLHLYPTNSHNRFTMLVDAFRIAYRTLSITHGEKTITAQDPLELGFLSYLLSRMTGAPYTVQVHGDYYSPFWTEGSLSRRFRRCFIPFVLGRAAKVRVVSDRVRRSLTLRGVQSERITVLPIRPRLEAFLDASRTRSDNTFTVLTASRLEPEKHIPFLVEAFAIFSRTHPNVRLRILGDGTERERIAASISAFGMEKYVELLPWSPHIEAEMANADVFVLASLHESYALVLIEALAAGTPVVTTDVGCAGEVVLNNVHGLIVSVNDVPAFALALERMYTDTTFRKEASTQGRALGKKLSEVREDAYAKEWVAAHTA